jgi:segregation and condensation protein A
LVKVNLAIFEGPLDLLLFLIKKSEIDINDIPIAKLTREYLAALDEMQDSLDLNVAGEFLVMAAQLMVIKSKMLLPAPETGSGEDGEAEDPRSELVARLLEYKQFKEAAASLGQRELMQREVFGRMGVERIAKQDAEKNALEEDGALDVNLFDLLRAFQRILDELPETQVREIGRDEVSVVQKMNEILDSLETKEFIIFQELFRGIRARPHLLATFLGMLELAKLRSVALRQAALFGDIRIYKRQDQEAGPAETAPAPDGGADMN